MKNKQELIKTYNENGPYLIRMMGGKIIDFNLDNRSCTFEFDISKDFCHSIDVVQGGFITAMLDAAMSHALMMSGEKIIGVSSLEIKTSYLEVTRAGKLKVEGYVLKESYKTAFLEGRMYNPEGVLTATTSSVSKVVRAKEN